MILFLYNMVPFRSGVGFSKEEEKEGKKKRRMKRSFCS